MKEEHTLFQSCSLIRNKHLSSMEIRIMKVNLVRVTLYIRSFEESKITRLCLSNLFPIFKDESSIVSR